MNHVNPKLATNAAAKDVAKDTPREGPPHIALGRDTLPVDCIKFPVAGYPDLPGKASASSVTTDPSRPRNRSHHVIEYVPAMRTFAVWFYSPDLAAPKLVYVPENRALTWTPA